MRLQVPSVQARRDLSTIEHASCQKAIPDHWIADQDGNVRTQSILWLFCWATTGQGSSRAANQARMVFNRIFDHSYEWLGSRINLEYAYRRRYAKFDIEGEFRARLGR